ncbi:STAS domain-containing protein [Nocardia sp. CDC159]|uniref:Anti-sigma factor antagonist n=1 Tax=Nocardia pulmonis TaxID=2951408 RepID=A0A9X2E878_9NOCA|nr:MULTISPECIES: STAS domain-containing protein [Nocardia]MCM6775385.1 STAS domain-containing protein [Nocardia pulmonis]MCM6787881.1 STAS domain-containing protein [Nocardia sp. CDC159]
MRYEDQWRGFRIDVNRVGAAMVVAATGEVDIHTAPRLQKAVDDAVAQRSGRLIVDLSRVEFFDSSGLNVLLHATRIADEVRVVAAHAARRPLEVTGLSEVIPIFDTIEDALGGPDGSDHR